MTPCALLVLALFLDLGEPQLPQQGSRVSDMANTTQNKSSLVTLFDSFQMATLQPAARIDYSVLPPIVVQGAVILTTKTSTDYDYDVLWPSLQAAYARARNDYNVLFDATNYLYEVDEVSSSSPDAKLGITQGCWMWNASGAAARALHDGKMQVMIGPACTDDMRATNELATFFRIPAITGAANLMEHNRNHDLLTRFGLNIFDAWHFMGSMFRRYNWSNIVMFFDADDIEHSVEASTFSKTMKARNVVVYDIPIKARGFENFTVIPALLREAKLHGRVFVFLLHGSLTRHFLVQCTKLGMSTGDYVFFTVDLLAKGILKHDGWRNRDGYDEEALDAYRRLLVISTRQGAETKEYRTFLSDLQKYNDSPDKCSSQQRAPLLTHFSSTFFDAILMFAMSVRKTLGRTATSIKTDDANDIVKKGLWNQTFRGASGTVHINEEGDRNIDLSLYFMVDDIRSKSFQVVMDFFGASRAVVDLSPIPWRTKTGLPPPNRPPCGFILDECPEAEISATVLGGTLAGGLAFLLVFFVVAGYLTCGKHATGHLDWLVDVEELSEDPVSTSSRMSFSTLSMSSTSSVTSDDQSKRATNKVGRAPPTNGRLFFVSYQGKTVMVTRLRRATRIVVGKQLTNEGIAIQADYCAVVTEYCSKASLQDLLADETHKLDWIFRFSLISDIVKGLTAIHSSSLRYHGRLTSACCYVDGKFVLKIGEYGLPSIFHKDIPQIEDGPYYRSLLWTAPEFLDRPNGGSQEGDIFSFGIILQEVILREEPYAMFDLEPDEIIDRVRSIDVDIFRPNVQSPGCPVALLALMDNCWQHDPQERPSLVQIKSAVRKITRGQVEKKNIVELLLKEMEEYNMNLQKTVEEKTKAAQEEKQRADMILSQILPPGVAEKLKTGEPVPAERFESVTIYFSHICDFHTLSMESRAIEIVDFLNDLYSLIDQTIPQFDVYKVETISDCYMMASGLPHRNGLSHVKELSRLSLTLMRLIRKFKIRHKPGEIAQLRIGLNTGPVVAAVIGVAVPRYCLFGDTVNVASRMESTSEGLKIQISPSTKYILDGFGGFEVEERGEIEVKGKGSMKTYWLISEVS